MGKGVIESEENIEKTNSSLLKNKALKTSIREGSGAAYASGTTISYAAPYALALGATNSEIGFLSAIPALLNPIAQFVSSRLMEKFHRKNIVTLFVFLQAITFLPLAVIGIMSYLNLASTILVYSFISFYTLLSVFGGLSYPPWFSWMGDLTNQKERGKYFARRNRALGLLEILGMLTGLILLDKFKTIPALIGFSTLFFLAFLSKTYSFYIIRKQYIPIGIKRKHEHIALKEFLTNNKTFNKFAFYNLFFNLSVFIASPFFTVYMLDKSQLNLNYFWFIMISIAGAIFNLLFLKLVGKFSDVHGNTKLLVASNLLFALNPLLWIVIKNPFGLIFVQLISGLANASFVIGFNNFSYNALEQKYRGIGIAYIAILSGIGAFLGPLLGGAILTYFAIPISKFVFLFIIAAILRFLISILFLPSISENKRENRDHYVNIAHPIKVVHYELNALNYFVHYLEKEESQSLKVLKPLKKNVLRK